MSTHQLVATKSKTTAKTKTDITTEQSQKLIQTMLTMSFGCLAFLRGLFPDDSFADQRFVPEKVDKNYNKQNTSQSTSIKIKTLVRGKSTEVDLLLNWLEKGVFQSIKLRYLKALSLGIFLKEDDPTDLLENYTFTFDYDEENNFKLRIGSSNNDEDGTSTISLLDSRKMAQQLMRRFIIITQSLEPLPQKKFLTLRLMFNDSAPPNYQPHLFKDATFEKPATVRVPSSTDPETFSVGSLDTKKHKMSLKVLSATDYEAEICQGGPRDFLTIDPFDLIEKDTGTGIKLLQSQQNYVASQTTNILGDILKSSQPSIQPTQAAVIGNASEVLCECGLDCPQESTKLKICKTCRKRVHGICYGNSRGSTIDRCLSCVYGPLLNVGTSEFKDLMMLRKCYRYLARKRSFPPSVSFFSKQILGPTPISTEIGGRIAFCISALFQDDILAINRERKKVGSQIPKAANSCVLVDISEIVTPDNGVLRKDNEYNWSFIFNSSGAHSCFMEVLAESKGQIDEWLEQIKEMRKTCVPSLPSSCDLQSLDISDAITQDTQGIIELGQKRKHVNLEQYLDEGSSEINDTMDMVSAAAAIETPRKIRKISVSKKSLRSNW